MTQKRSGQEADGDLRGCTVSQGIPGKKYLKKRLLRSLVGTSWGQKGVVLERDGGEGKHHI